MSEFDFDEVMGSVTNPAAEDSFRERLLVKSQKTLVRGRFRRRVFRGGGIFSFVLLVAVNAFLCGRFSGESSDGDIRVATNDESVVVSAELVAWLDAGRFFEQIDMPDRAAKAYKCASKMIPSQNVEQHAFGTDDTMQLASLLQRAESIAIENEKINSRESGNCMLATIIDLTADH